MVHNLDDETSDLEVAACQTEDIYLEYRILTLIYRGIVPNIAVNEMCRTSMQISYLL